MRSVDIHWQRRKRSLTIAAMSGPAEIEACHDRLHRAGWSIGEVGTSSGWLVAGTNGENVIDATATTQAEVWRLACDVIKVTAG
jgi:hypothetical protein